MRITLPPVPSFYLGHEDEITCLTLSPHDRDTVATGGTGTVPKLQIWSASTLGAPGEAPGEGGPGAAAIF